MNDERAVLSICMTCRSGRETETGTRGGLYLAKRIQARIDALTAVGVTLRGVKCMSQCTRPYIISLGQDDKFTYDFGDLNPHESAHIEELLELVERYDKAAQGFLKRRERLELLRANILGRFPPIRSASPLVSAPQSGPCRMT